MKIKCSWCGSWINDFDEVCPNCGGTNENFRRQGTGVPQTVEELKEWAKKHNLPLRQMRTYIGENYTGAKAFGIYKDEASGNFVVYKNKADGTRSVRYEGPDEAYAVNELYLKMKERVAEQKSHQEAAGRKAGVSKGPVYLNTGNPVGYENRRSLPKRGSRVGKTLKHILLIYLIMGLCITALYFYMSALGRSPSTGYYNYNGNMYYWQNTTDAWYIYNYDATQWDKCYDNLDYLYDNYDDYRIASYSYGDYDVTDFTESGYYVETPSYSNDNDSGWDYDWDDDYDWNDDYDWDDSWDDWDSDW